MSQLTSKKNQDLTYFIRGGHLLQERENRSYLLTRQNLASMTYVVIINVIDILNGQKFSFPMNSDSSYRIKHLKHEMNTLVRRFGEHRLLFIRNGKQNVYDVMQMLLLVFFCR